MRTRLSLDLLRGGSFGDAFVREFDLVVAANQFMAVRDGVTVYDNELGLRAAERCAPLDLGLRERFLGIRDVHPIPGAPHAEVEAATEFLMREPRGTWAVFRHHGGGYDSYMADGLGGVCGRTGRRFDMADPEHREINFLSTYAAMLGTPLYHRRDEMRREITRATFEASGAEPGKIARDVLLSGKRYDKVEYVGRDPAHPKDGADGFGLRCSRRGVRTLQAWTNEAGYVAIFSPPAALPRAYADAFDEERTSSVTERRRPAAQAAYDRLVGEGEVTGVSNRGSKAPFRESGDTFTRAMLREGDDEFMGTITITFARGSDAVVSAEATLDHAPLPGMR